jgi:glycine/D-amino acid oxidase-like deaminating enzyme
MPVYLPFLISRFRARGGRTERISIQHISQLLGGAYTKGSFPSAIIICTGLGSRFLGGVEDRDMYPIRGQTVLLKAPWIRFGRTLSSLDGLWTYIIPRRSGDVIVGGSKIDNDWYGFRARSVVTIQQTDCFEREPKPRPDETEDILRRALALAPELSPAFNADKSHEPDLKDLEDIVISENCGLRPGRKGGIRLESGVIKNATGLQIPVIYNYG